MIAKCIDIKCSLGKLKLNKEYEIIKKFNHSKTNEPMIAIMCDIDNKNRNYRANRFVIK